MTERDYINLLMTVMRELPDMTLKVDLLWKNKDQFKRYDLVDCGVDPANGIYTTFRLIEKLSDRLIKR